jgi:NAD(P)-dependent dehydrogenase (short-subunit alcohol dehydrogenase family)
LESLFPEWTADTRVLFAGGVDLNDAASVAEAARAAVERFEQVDVLVNAAGGFRSGPPVHESTVDDWDYLLDLNARTVFIACRAFIPHMLAYGSGKIVNIAAKAGLAGSANMAAYSASKSAVIRITEALAAELKGRGINVNCVLPSTIDTPQNRLNMPKADPARWVAPEALADVIAFLASDLARAVHGAALPVYGLS